MNKKGQIYIIAIILILALLAFFFLRITSPDEDAERAEVGQNPIENIGNEIGFDGVRDPIDTTQSQISFEGFGPGKSHVGKFNDWSGELYLEDNKVVGFEGRIMADSVDTGIEGLDKHLMAEDFFNVAENPKIKFVSSNLNGNTLTGDLTFLGTTKEISFPVEITGKTISADFVLDTAQFGEMNKAANSEVRIFFELSA